MTKTAARKTNSKKEFIAKTRSYGVCFGDIRKKNKPRVLIMHSARISTEKSFTPKEWENFSDRSLLILATLVVKTGNWALIQALPFSACPHTALDI